MRIRICTTLSALTALVLTAIAPAHTSYTGHGYRNVQKYTPTGAAYCVRDVYFDADGEGPHYHHYHSYYKGVPCGTTKAWTYQHTHYWRKSPGHAV